MSETAKRIAEQMNAIGKGQTTLDQAASKLNGQTSTQWKAQNADDIQANQNSFGANLGGFEKGSQEDIAVSLADINKREGELTAQTQDNLLNIQLNNAKNVLDQRLGYSRDLQNIAKMEQQRIVETGSTDLNLQQGKLDTSYQRTKEDLLQQKEEGMRVGQFQAALTGRSSYAAGNVINSIIKDYQGNLTKAQEDYFTSTQYIANLKKDLSDNATIQMAKIDIEAANSINEAFNTYQYTYDQVMEGKKANEATKALLNEKIGMELQKTLFDISDKKAQEARRIFESDRSYALEKAGFDFSVQNAERTYNLEVSKFNFDIDSFNKNFARQQKMDNVEIQRVQAEIDQGYKRIVMNQQEIAIAQNRYNLDVAKFNQDMSNDALANSLAVQEMELKRMEMEQDGLFGVVNEAYDNKVELLLDDANAFNKLNSKEKTAIINYATNTGKDTQRLQISENFQSLSVDDKAGLAQYMQLYENLLDAQNLSKNVNTGSIAQYAGEAAVYFGGGEEYQTLARFVGNNLVDYVKEMSGTQVTDGEREYLQGLVPFMDQQDFEFDNNLEAMRRKMETKINTLMVEYGVKNKDDLYSLFGVKPSSLYSGLSPKLQKRYGYVDQSDADFINSLYNQ